MSEVPNLRCEKCAANGLTVPMVHKPSGPATCPLCEQMTGRPRMLVAMDRKINDQGLYVTEYVCPSPRCPFPRTGVIETTDMVCTNCGNVKELVKRAEQGRVVMPAGQAPYRLPPDMPQPPPGNEELLRNPGFGAGVG